MQEYSIWYVILHHVNDASNNICLKVFLFIWEDYKDLHQSKVFAQENSPPCCLLPLTRWWCGPAPPATPIRRNKRRLMKEMERVPRIATCGSSCRSSLIRAERLWSQEDPILQTLISRYTRVCVLLKGWSEKRYICTCQCFFSGFLFVVGPFEDNHSWNSQSVALSLMLLLTFWQFLLILITVRKINWHQQIASFICYNFESKIIPPPPFHLCNESLFQVDGLVDGN